MFELGSRVTYIRPDKANAGKTVEGNATALGIVLDANKRRVVICHDTSQPEAAQRFNVDVKCINASEEFKAQYREAVAAVVKRSAELNNQITEFVTTGNAEVDKIWSEVLGEPVTFDLPSSGSAANDEKAAA